MTLGFAIGTNAGIHQSSDLRLTYPAGGVYKDPTPKAVVVAYRSWFGIITFAGIGAITYAETTCDWLAGLVVRCGEDLSTDELAEAIRREASVWLRPLPAASRKHSFVLSGITKGGPRLLVISNWEYANGRQLDQARSEFFISQAQVRRPLSDPALVVTGWRPAVSKQDRVGLRWAVRKKMDHLAARKRMAEINETVANRSEAAGRISVSCFVLSLLPDGHVWGELYGDTKEKFLVKCICQGI